MSKFVCLLVLSSVSDLFLTCSFCAIWITSHCVCEHSPIGGWNVSVVTSMKIFSGVLKPATRPLATGILVLFIDGSEGVARVALQLS